MKILLYRALTVLAGMVSAQASVTYLSKVALLNGDQIEHVVGTFMALMLVGILVVYVSDILIRREKSNQKFKFVKSLGDTNERD